MQSNSVDSDGMKASSLNSEDLSLSLDEQSAYDAASAFLFDETASLMSYPSVVSIEELPVPDNATTNDSRTTTPQYTGRDFMVDEHPRNEAKATNNFFSNFTRIAASRMDATESNFLNLPTPTRDRRYMRNALEKLDTFEKEEALLISKATITRQLTQIVTGECYTSSGDAAEHLKRIGHAVPRRVCQHPFKKNDIVWVCRTCQADETCVLCHTCFSQSNHEGHDVAFYHAQAGGCCDCGDPDAWDPSGFCPHHGPNAISVDPSSAGPTLPENLVSKVRGVVPSCIDWLVKEVANNAETAYKRANPLDCTSFEAVNDNNSISKDDDFGNLETHVIGADITTDSYSSNTLSEGMDFDATISDTVENTGNVNQTGFNYNCYINDAHVFSPDVASQSRKSKREMECLQQQENEDERALQLGLKGSKGRGIYIVLHSDDIHSTQQIQEALREFFKGSVDVLDDALLKKMIIALRQFGQLALWGLMELAWEVGSTQIQLWMDGDRVASTRIGAVVIKRAKRLSSNGLFCSILTRNELMMEQRAVAVLQWLSFLARSCDPLCITVAESILPNRHLVPLLIVDFKMSARVTKAWYSLLLTLLAVPVFKSHLAAAYCDTYRCVTSKYAHGMGVFERSGYTLSVQFLNRMTYVVDLVQKRDLLGKLGKALLETLTVACSDNMCGRLDPNHFVLTHRRYSPCVSDLKCVLNVEGMPRVTVCKNGTFFSDWIRALSVAQFMDPQIWRDNSRLHIEDEPRGWVGAFNASISLGSLFERLVCWGDADASPIENSSSPLSGNLMTCVEMTYFLLTSEIDRWQKHEFRSYLPTVCTTEADGFKQCPSSLPFSTIASKRGTALAMRQLPISQVTPFSFHLPLHRFLSSCLRELCLRTSDCNSVGGLLTRLKANLDGECHDDLFFGLMEFSLLVLTRAAQVRAGLWNKNGSGLHDQVLNYAEPPFCRNMRDADLLLTQFAVIGRTDKLSVSKEECVSGMSFLSNLLLHRLAIFDFIGMKKAPNENHSQYLIEMNENGLYPTELDDTLPWTYSPVENAASSMLLVEEFLLFMIVFVSELPPAVPISIEEQTSQAKFRLLREVVHRLASGQKTHSELSEVHHVLSHSDNLLLSKEGKVQNPDDATGAALESILTEVAERKITLGKMEPDKWQLRLEAWKHYDPAFFHISLRCHQVAAEGRPSPTPDTSSRFGWKSKPYAPEPGEAHIVFKRLRRDATSDTAILSVIYRILHLHCGRILDKDVQYMNREKSETALARALHLITLGLYAWKDVSFDTHWRDCGGGSPGSLLYKRIDSCNPPTIDCWISHFLLADPSQFIDCDSYNGGENALLLLERLAVQGGVPGNFIAQDSAIRAGAAWICEFALLHSSDAKTVLSTRLASTEDILAEKKKKIAKETAFAKVKEQAAKFASMMDIDLDDDSGECEDDGFDQQISQKRPSRKFSFASIQSSSSSAVTKDSEPGNPPKVLYFENTFEDKVDISARLLNQRPRCIICNYEDYSEAQEVDKSDDGHGQRKKSKKRGENALGLVGYAQASTVLKGGGGAPPSCDSISSPLRDYVGTHVALCGHAVHSECWESYLSTLANLRPISKREEFRCPLCQRLSNCLVPFIDVSVDWIDSVTCLPVPGHDERTKEEQGAVTMPSLENFVDKTPWWVTRQYNNIEWNGRCAFVEKHSEFSADDRMSPSQRPMRKIRSLKKKDLYASWNAMMRSPRMISFRRRFQRTSSQSSSSTFPPPLNGEDSMGETVVWTRFMNQISDISYLADMKRLGERFNDLFGEFRHYIVEKYAYNVVKKINSVEPTDWPGCLYTGTMSDSSKQVLSREKLLSKLFLSIQAFTYTSCCEAFEVKRAYLRCVSSSDGRPESTAASLFLRFGVKAVVNEGTIVILPIPSAQEDEGSSPFDGRIGRLRYFALAVMAAAGAVAADLVQLVLPFALLSGTTNFLSYEEYPQRAPITFPILLGHVLTHTIAAMCAVCGRARALHDSVEVLWSVPFSEHGQFISFPDERNCVNAVVEDCLGFIKMGLLARILQCLLGSLHVPVAGLQYPGELLRFLREKCLMDECKDLIEYTWMKTCVDLLEIAFLCPIPSEQEDVDYVPMTIPSMQEFMEACLLALNTACSFLADSSFFIQLLIPGFVLNLDVKGPSTQAMDTDQQKYMPVDRIEKMLDLLYMEPIHVMLESKLVHGIVSEWYMTSCAHNRPLESKGNNCAIDIPLHNRLTRTHGFRVFDWPSSGEFDCDLASKSFLNGKHEEGKNSLSNTPQTSTIINSGALFSTTAILRNERSHTVVTANCKKRVPLFGGYSRNDSNTKARDHPHIASVPLSYTDLYAELCALMPDCEQIAFCFICGDVLNAGGLGECTRHSHRCGAGAGMFFLLQECSCLLMHNNSAVYIQSPYVDSHGETPQFRGRPLNLDVHRYEHLREIWFTHNVRNKVGTERGTSRLVMH